MDARSLVLRVALALVAAATAPLLAPSPVAAATLDPNIRMHTLETPHFRVNYPEGYDRIAQKAAQFAEEAHVLVSGYFQTVPKNKTEFTLFDHEDTVNGLALPYVNNAMYIYLTTPDADLMWGRYDNWLKLVITHEYTHVLHFETTGGLPKLVNDVFGRLLFPNLFQPTFLIEGLAVTTESLWTNAGKGGRGNDGNYDMYLRGDVLEGRQLTIDQAGGYYLTDFPGGDAPYVYGTYFYKYVAETYGADKPPLIAREYGTQPWLGIDAAVSRAIPGHTTQDIWDELVFWLRRRADAQLAEIRKRPVTPTKALTRTAYHHRHPLYLPDGRLMYIEGLRHAPTALKVVTGYDEDGKPVTEKLMSKGQYGDFDVSRDGKTIWYANSHGRNNYSSYEDVFKLDLETGEQSNLTDFARIGQPGISPDGKQLLAVRNGKGNNDLLLLDAATGKVLRQLSKLDDNTQFTAPRWSPDGTKAVMSAWRGSSRDLYMIDTKTWQIFPLWKDDAVDMGPVWSPDGERVIFSSDRDGGVFNLFAYDWRKREVWRMTNVLTGVVEPAVSPDGREVAMAYCRGVGFDIHTMPYDPATWTPASPPAIDPTIKPYVHVQKEEYPSHGYNPLPSMAPKFWTPLFQSNPLSLGVFTIGYDVLLTNTIFGMAGWSLQGSGYTDPTTKAFVPFSPLDQTLATFLYQNSQFDTNVSLSGNWYPFKYAIPLNNGTTLDLFQRFQTYSVSLGWNNVPSPLTNASYQTGDTHNLAYNVRIISNLTPDALNQEAVDAKLLPRAGRTNSLSYTYKYNDNGKYGYSIAPEYGRTATYGLDVALPQLGSEYDYYRGFADWRAYVGTPWTHHVLGFRGMLGINLGRPQGDFYLGGNRSINQNGTPDIRVAAEPDDVLIALRGYPFASATGNTAALASGEYRFPIMELQHGPGTLPVFAERLAGVFFADSGTTYTNNWLSFTGRTAEKGAKPYPDLTDLRLGLGAELRLNFKIANNPLNTVPLATIARSAVPSLQAFNDSAGILRVGVAQPALPISSGGVSQFLGPTVYTEFGTFF